MKHGYKKLLWLTILVSVDTVFFGLVNPQQVYALIIIFGFLLVVVTAYVLFDLLLILFEKVIPISAMTRHRLHLSATMLFALLLAMQSIGQLTVKDIMAMIPLVLVAAFYVSYQKKQLRR